jgi:hypothetical protein
MRYFVLFVLLAIVAVWLIQRAWHDSQAEKAVDQTTDYLTGKTPVDILIQQTVNTRRLEIQNAVRYFEGMNGRPPKSLDELVEEGDISEEDKYIKYGNVKYAIESGLTPDGKFFIQGLGKDRKKGTKDDWQYVF